MEVDIIMSILYFTIIAFYFAIKSGWKTPKYFSFSDVGILVERGEVRADGKAVVAGRGERDNCCHILVFR